MERDIIADFAFDQVMVPVLTAPTIDADGLSVDMKGYDRCTFVASLGDSGDTLAAGLYVELEVEESDDDSSFTDVPDADLQGFVAGNNDGCFAYVDAPAEDQTVFVATYKGSSRYVRPVLNVTGTHTNGIPISIVAIRHAKHGLR